jgi:hypothetical protein
LPERDPTEGIDVIEIMVTKEISVRIEEPPEKVVPYITSAGQDYV